MKPEHLLRAMAVLAILAVVLTACEQRAAPQSSVAAPAPGLAAAAELPVTADRDAG